MEKAAPISSHLSTRKRGHLNKSRNKKKYGQCQSPIRTLNKKDSASMNYNLKANDKLLTPEIKKKFNFPPTPEINRQINDIYNQMSFKENMYSSNKDQKGVKFEGSTSNIRGNNLMTFKKNEASSQSLLDFLVTKKSN